MRLESHSEIELPAYRHLPGINPRPDGGVVERIANAAPAITDPDRAQSNVAWCYGLRLIHHGYYWEAHEVLEPVWFRAAPNSRERYLVQGFIQFANACLKAEMTRRQAALRLAAITRDCFRDAARQGESSVMGVDPYRAIEATGQFEQALEERADWKIAVRTLLSDYVL